MPPMPLMPPRIFAPAGSSFNTKDPELLTLGAGAGGNGPIMELVPAWPVIITSPAESTRMLSRPGAEVSPGVTSVAPPTKVRVDDLAGRVQFGNEALKGALHGGLQSAGRNRKIRRVGITENIDSAAGIDRDGPRDSEVAAGQGRGIKRLPGGAQFGNERVGLSEISLKAGDIDVARGIGLNRIDHAVGEVRQSGDGRGGARENRES